MEAAPEPLSPLKSGVGAVLWGALVGVLVLLMQSWVGFATYLGPPMLVLPFGAVLGSVLVWASVLAWSLKAGRMWVPATMGGTTLLVIALAAMGRPDMLLVPLTSAAFEAVPGAASAAATTYAGTILATLIAVAMAARVLARRRAAGR